MFRTSWGHRQEEHLYMQFCIVYFATYIEQILPSARHSGTLYRLCHSAHVLHVSNIPSGT
jgi:hypothetical protein